MWDIAFHLGLHFLEGYLPFCFLLFFLTKEDANKVHIELGLTPNNEICLRLFSKTSMAFMPLSTAFHHAGAAIGIFYGFYVYRSFFATM